MLSKIILSYVTGFPRSTSEIEAHLNVIGGFSQMQIEQVQIDGAIGYLRAKGFLQISAKIKNPNGRAEHVFY